MSPSRMQGNVTLVVGATLVALLALPACESTAPPSVSPADLSFSTHALLTDGLLGHWMLDETTGTTAADATGNGNTAAFNVNAQWATGRIDGAAHVTGGGYLQAQPSTTLNSPTTAISLAGWFRRESNPASGDQYLVYRRNTTIGTVVHILQGSNGVVCFSVIGQQICDGIAPPGEWHHVAGTWDGMTTRLYVDGVLRSTSAATGTLVFEAGFSLFLGSNQGGSLAYDGRLDDWRVYGRALSADEAWKLAHPEATDCELAMAGTACDDGNPCTSGETCQDSVCSAAGATISTCDAANLCGCPTEKRAVLVVGNTTLNAGDAALQARLEAVGYVVLVVRDVDVRTYHAENKDVVVISETVASANVTPSLAAVAPPMVTLEPGLFDDQGMTGLVFNTDLGDTAATQIAIADAGHAMAAGLSGTVTFASTSQQIGWGVPAATAVTIATLASDPTRAAIFGYHAGAQMVTGTAPARRVGFFARGAVPSALNAAGWALFDAAVAWAASESPSALLVVGAQSPAGDAALRTRLQGTLGYDVQVVAQAQATLAHAAPHRLVIVSETVSSGVIAGLFTNIAKPVMALEGGIWGAMGMTGPDWNTDWGAVETTAGQTSVHVSASGHALTAGLSGTLTIGSAPLKFMWGVPAETAVVAATLSSEGEGATRATVFGYRAGAAMVTGTAPARRVGFFAGDVTPSLFNANGWALFDAAVHWLILPEQTAAFVVADATMLNSSDAAIRNRLVGLDYEVELHSGPTVEAAHVSGAHVVVLSESIVSSTVGTRLTPVAVPLVSLEPALFDELGMTGAVWQTNQGDALSQTQVTITDSAHPLAAGFAAGNVTVTTTPAKFVWGAPPAVPAAVAQRVATISGQANQHTIFGYQAGATMVTGTAPARRVGWFAGSETAQHFNDNGWRLFDAAIRWARAAPGQCEGQPDGTACEDGNACTVADRCTAGVCGGDTRSCTDGNGCTVDSCNPAAGCLYDGSTTDGATCDDGNVCTTGDVCLAGMCMGTPSSALCMLVPHVACVESTTGGTIAHLGYVNPTTTVVSIAPGSAGNHLSPAPIAGATPGSFAPGVHEDAFRLTYTGASLSWTLGTETVVASTSSPACCAGAPPGMGPGTPPEATIVYRDGWESCHPSGAWRDDIGNETAYATPADASMAAPLDDWSTCRGDSGRVQAFVGGESTSGSASRSSWFNLVSVTAGQTYCLAAWINWVGGRQPYVDIVRFDDTMTPVGARHAMIGAGNDDGLGGSAIAISVEPGFHRYRKSFSVPTGTSFLQIENGVVAPGGGSASKPAPELSYFDDVVLAEGACGL